VAAVKVNTVVSIVAAAEVNMVYVMVVQTPELKVNGVNDLTVDVPPT
jgi:hypothetical protein